MKCCLNMKLEPLFSIRDLCTKDSFRSSKANMNRAKVSIRLYGLLIALLSLGLTACASVEPWEKGILAKPEMGWTLDPVEAAMDSHIFFSKEGSSGGSAAGGSGGGCGCN